MKTFKSYLNEEKKRGYYLEFIRTKDYDALRINQRGDSRWAEVRGKKNYEGPGYDAKDPLHKTLDNLGKALDVGDLLGGKVVVINPQSPYAKKAFAAAKWVMDT